MTFVEQVKSSVDIVKVIGDYGIRLKKLGSSGSYVGLCPFHQEKTPSFRVHATHQFYKCFGCDAKGDVFNFVQTIEKVSFFEALKITAERNGIPMPKRAEYSDPESKLRGALLEAHEVAAQLFREHLHSPAGTDARAYLAKRGVTPGQTEEFCLGLAPDSWDQLTRRLQERRIPNDVIEQSGLVLRRDSGGIYDRFRNRLMFPIHNESGRIIAFGGRALKPGDEPKYLNSPETEIYKKSSVLYNLHRAKDAIRKLENAVLVEGYMDAIAVYSAGVHEVVASCGTSLTNSQVRAIKKYSAQIVVNFDPDNAGAKAAERSIQMLLEEGMRVRVLELQEGLDPDEYVKEHGADGYRDRLQQASAYFHWLAERARKKFDVRTSDGRIAGLQYLLPAIQRVSDKLERATIAEEVASYLGVDRGLVLEQFRKLATKAPGEVVSRPSTNIPASERLLLNALLMSEQARREVLPKICCLQVYERLIARPIFDVFVAASGEDRAFSFTDIEARLNDRDRDLLSALVFADEMGEEINAMDQAMQCLRALQAQEMELSRSTLRERIRAAERSGDFQAAMSLMEEFNQLSVKRNP